MSNIRNIMNYKRICLSYTGIFAFCILCISCGRDVNNTTADSMKGKPSQIVKDAHLLRSVNGVVDVELFSDLIQVYSGDSAKMCFPKGINLIFLNQDLSTKATLRADYAVNYKWSEVYYIRDSVVIIDYCQQDTFYCRDLFWIKDSAMLRTDLPIRHHSASGIDFGSGLRARDNFDSIMIMNPYGTQTVEEEQD